MRVFKLILMALVRKLIIYICKLNQFIKPILTAIPNLSKTMYPYVIQETRKKRNKYHPFGQIYHRQVFQESRSKIGQPLEVR